MVPSRRPVGDGSDGEPSRRLLARASSTGAAFLLVLSRVPVAAAHGATATGGLSRWHGLVLALGGLAVLTAAVVGKRTGRIAPTVALYGAFAGIAVTAAGAILFDGLSPDAAYGASSMPFPRAWYPALSLSLGLSIVVGSFVGGWLRWPTRPRYTFLGILAGTWIAYPSLVPGPGSHVHPLGYAVVLVTPLLVGHVVREDAWDVLRPVLRDPVARRFGVGIGVVVALFFTTLSGYLTFFPDPEAPHEVTVAVLPAVYHLVTWPTFEVFLPHVPLFVAVSPGLVIVVGLLSALVGANAALVAHHWRAAERAGGAESAAGTAAVVGSCTCGCCGPLVAKVAVLAAGPSIAAPLYWVFVDSASPLGTAFVVGSVLLFTASLLHSVGAARGPPAAAVGGD